MQVRTIFMAALAAVGLAAAVPAQQAWNTVKEWDSGPSDNRLDIVVLGDGYRAQDIPLFRTHVTAFVNAFVNTTPMTRYKNNVNIWRVEVESQDAGADRPAACFNPQVLVNTALGGQYCTGGTERCLTANTSLALQTAVINVPEYDYVMVVVNDTLYGGCAGTISTYVGGHASSTSIAIHELGHSIYGLADEYWTNGTTYTGPELNQENVTIQDASQIAASGTKWAHWLNIEGVSAFEGGRYHEFGIFRPKNGCKMRSLGSAFCPVCREVALETLWEEVTAPDNPTPAPGTHPTGTMLSVDLPAMGTGTITTEWVVDGTTIHNGTQSTQGNVTTASFDPSVLAPGSHTVTLHVYDDSTWYRRTPRLEVMSPTTWILSDTHSDHVITAMTIDTPPAREGHLFQVSDTVVNNGLTAGPPVHVGYYFSLSPTNITTADRYLGGRDVPALGIGQSDSGTAWVRVPAENMPQAGYIGAIVDDRNESAETDETNNLWVDPAVHPIDTAPTLTASQYLIPHAVPIDVDLTLAAGAAHAGEEYYLFPSLANPAPGTDFGPFVGTAPFVFDEISVLVGTQTPPTPVFFQNFAGTLGPSGDASAHWYLPALPPGTPGFPVQFWYFTYDPNSNLVPLFSNWIGVLTF